ncbi:MAG TPA: hypothetical protein VNX68_15950, partial [Nitrosopumilaceae archaeon]|nr:hypothetical protein [Nitrosopumilaceae archaeon]
MKKSLKTPKIFKTALTGVAVLSVIAWITPKSYYQFSMENEFIRSIKQKTEVYNKLLPEDRVYVSFDKPFYEPGETIWFSASICDGLNLKPSIKSDIIHVEFINPKGSVEKTMNIIAKNGKAAGDILLDE